MPTSMRMTIETTTKSKKVIQALRPDHLSISSPAVVTMTSRPTQWAARSRLMLYAVLMIRPDPGQYLHQHNIVLLLAQIRLHLQRHRLADEIDQHRQMLRLFLEKQIDHLLRSDHAKLARIELS